MQKLFEKVFLKLFPWRGRKQLESPADFFGQPAEIFPLEIQENNNL